jgi:hypothetical protein
MEVVESKRVAFLIDSHALNEFVMLRAVNLQQGFPWKRIDFFVLSLYLN